MMGQIGSAIAGNITLSGAGATQTWVNPNTLGTNESMNINDWSQVELQNFVKWFIEVNYPEAVKEYQAIRDIERQAQEAERLKHENEMAEMMRGYYAQNAYQNPQSLYTALPTQAITMPPPPKQESIWDAMKRMAGYGK